MGPINSLSSSYLPPVINTVGQGNSSTTGTTANSISGIGTTSDNSQLSPFVRLMSALQQLQQSDPTKYQQVTQQIAANLQSAAQTAQADGNSTAASQLNQLAADFTNASQSGQLPNMQDLGRAIGGHHHHHHVHPPSGDAEGNSSAASSSSGTSSSRSSNSSASQSLSQLLSSFQANGTQNDLLNPMAIILNTLSDAGITGSKG